MSQLYCHGCGGKGWVDSVTFGPSVCPLCKGTGYETVQITVTNGTDAKDDKNTVVNNR